MTTDGTSFNSVILDNLLDMEEGHTVDFKREQYRFQDASKDDKSELLKDILAFANAQRYRTAYILIGVEEMKGERSLIVGTESHLDDAELHQFINSKTNRPVVFDYFPYRIKGTQVGVLRIPLQSRPIYTLRKYGKIDANVVYIRDGSTTRPASPDEIALMGRGTPPQWALDRLAVLSENAVLTAVRQWHENPYRQILYDAKIKDDVRFGMPLYEDARAFILNRSHIISKYESGVDSYDSLHWVFVRFEELAWYCTQMFRTVGSALVEYGALVRAMTNMENYVEKESRRWRNFLNEKGADAPLPEPASYNLLTAAALAIRLVDVIKSENFSGDAEYEHTRMFAPEIHWQSREWHE